MRKSNSTVVAKVLENQAKYWQQWQKHTRWARKNLKAETDEKEDLVEVDFSKFTPKKYLLSHATIVGGVQGEKDKPWIVIPHSKWINDNGNAWFNQVLLESYRSFIMAENYLEHVQIPAFSKGKILDAVAWVVRELEPGQKETIPTVFIDILVATNKIKHPKLVAKIMDGTMNGLSMGCSVTHTQCSQCGEVFEEGETQCGHLEENLGGSFRDDEGLKRRVAEMCGVPGIPGSNIYVEASWVKTPAFSPAIRHSSLKMGETWLGSPLRAYVPKERLKDAAKED